MHVEVPSFDLGRVRSQLVSAAVEGALESSLGHAVGGALQGALDSPLIRKFAGPGDSEGVGRALCVSQAGRGTSPVFDRRIFSFARQFGMHDMFNEAESDPRLLERYLDAYVGWLEACAMAPVSGLQSFGTRYYVNGVTQAYDLFFSEHRERRFRVLRDEYPYVRLSVPRWLHVEDAPLQAGDALVLSCPYYATGGVPRDFGKLLNHAQELEVPVFVDAAYFGTCYDVRFDFSHPAIEMVGFSLSKPFSLQSCRVGLLLSRRKLGCLEEIQVAARYFNRFGAHIGLKMMSRFSADFLPSQHSMAHREVCERLGVLPASSIMLGSVPKGDSRFDEILADDRFGEVELPPGVLRRVCVSGYLGYHGSPLRLAARRALGRD